ncbi:NAD(P)-dependent oxidoreductase [Streptacidiphilus pinicola]|uniref:NAD(P)-dependent oxidoreductase n=1 Tax=Streptacidiphilus pinicola TaxID=2219663 RepID=A0A2X0IHE4_9ACTN|nr:NAD-dependent epimerase/dehydratase family protein [Streptacidiphilus pinicola]RAG83023.1 NAD(P)-dependent oxidoreductase [Streptacidiphilus pinicola]
MSSRILLTGGSGFVGSHVLGLLQAGGDRVRVLRHRRGLPGAARTGLLEVVTGDLRDAGSLHGVCDGVGTVLHLAVQIGGAPETCRQVNELGTAALLAEARRAGVRRFVALSTTAVYRDGVHRGAGENLLPLDPHSATSRTRLAAERRVVAADGIVLRPHLVYGTGDRWVIPALVELLSHVPRWVGGGRARVSVIAVEDLARHLVALARTPWDPTPGGEIYHACEPEPVRIRYLARLVAAELGLALPAGEITAADALALLPDDEAELWQRRLSLLGVDHWYDGRRLWQRTGVPPSPATAERFNRHAAWYRGQLGCSGAVPQRAGPAVQPPLEGRLGSAA